MNLIPWRNKRDRGNSDQVMDRTPSGFREGMDSMTERFFRNPWDAPLWGAEESRMLLGPRVDLAESENDVTVNIELPGVDPKDVELNVSGNILIVRGEKKHEREEKKRNYHYMERSFGSFQRTVQLPSSVDPDKVEATHRNGVLTVTVEKRPDARPKRIAVKEG